MTRPTYDREARRTERERLVRLSKLPVLYEFALRGRWQSAAAAFVQILLAVALTLLVARLLTGELLPRWVAFAALGVSFALQALARYLNARAGRR